jgi:hypothetical protein
LELPSSERTVAIGKSQKPRPSEAWTGHPPEI